MSGKRRSIMIDNEYAEILEKLAKRHGLSIASYLRSLINAAKEAEDRGYYAPRLLTRALIYEAFSRLRSIPTPVELICSDYNKAYSEGKKIGLALRGLGLDVGEVLSLLVERTGIGAAEYSRLVLFGYTSGENLVIREFIRGVAEGAGYTVSEVGDSYVIKLSYKLSAT